jgi:hypothetical protein
LRGIELVPTADEAAEPVPLGGVATVDDESSEPAADDDAQREAQG